MVGGYGNVGVTSVDYMNIKRNFLSYIQGVDTQLVIDQFAKKKKTSLGFCFEYEVDFHEQLCRVFQADALAEKNYAVFGDVVSFYATYNTKK